MVEIRMPGGRRFGQVENLGEGQKVK